LILGFSRFSGTKEIIRIDNKHFFFNFSQCRGYLSLLRMISIPFLYPLRCFEILQIPSRDSRTTEPAVRGRGRSQKEFHEARELSGNDHDGLKVVNIY